MDCIGKIIRSKNGTIITPYRKKQCKQLEYATSMYDHVYHKTHELTGFRVSNYQDSTAFITHGNSKSYLQSLFPLYQIEQMRQNKAEDVIIPFELNLDIQLKEIQSRVANQVVMSRKKCSEWFINLQTGVGKTVLGVHLSSYFAKKTMIICFLNDILKQWKKTYAEKTNIDTSRILEINSGKMLEEIYLTNGCPSDNEDYFYDYDIFLISPSLITSYLNKHDQSELYKIFDTLGIGLLIFDEGHRNMGTIVKVNALTNVRYTIYLSADFAQGMEEREKKYYKIFNNTMIIKPEGEEADKMKYTSIIVVDYDSRPSVNENASIYTKYGYSSELYMEYQMKKGKIFDVMNHIIELIKKNRKPEYKTLILLNHISHVDRLYQYLKEAHSQIGMIIGRYHSQIADEEKEATIEFADVIVSTYKSFGTGMDIHNIKYVIGLNQSNKVEDNQAAGRARPLSDGSNAIYFMVVDIGFSYCKRKLKTRLAYLSETKTNEPPFVYHM